MKPLRIAIHLTLCALLAMATAKDFPKPNGRSWPEKVNVTRLPQPVEISPAEQTGLAPLPSEIAFRKWHTYETRNFHMLCDQPLAPAALRELGRLLEATWELNCVLPLNWEPTLPKGQTRYVVRIFAQSADYHAAQGPGGSSGVYLPKRNEVLVPARTLGADKSQANMKVERQTEDQGTLVHEVTHLMMHAWLPNLPLWFSEGAAEYVSAADYSSGEFRLKNQLTHVRQRIEKRLTVENERVSWMPLEDFFQLNNKEWQSAMTEGKAPVLYATALALTTYFYHSDDAIFRFVDEVRKGIPYPRPLNEHLMQGRSTAELEQAVEAFWAKNGLKLRSSRRKNK
jgi:hypothetical protein